MSGRGMIRSLPAEIPYVGRRRRAVWPTDIPKSDRFCWAGRRRSFSAEWRLPQVGEPVWMDIAIEGRNPLLIEVIHGTLGIRHGATWIETGPLAAVALSASSVQVELGLDRETNPHGVRALLHFPEPFWMRDAVQQSAIQRAGLHSARFAVPGLFALSRCPSVELHQAGRGAACSNPGAFFAILFNSFDTGFARFCASGPCEGMGEPLPPVTEEDLRRAEENYWRSCTFGEDGRLIPPEFRAPSLDDVMRC